MVATIVCVYFLEELVCLVWGVGLADCLVGWYVNWLCYFRYVNSLMSVIVHLLTLYIPVVCSVW